MDATLVDIPRGNWLGQRHVLLGSCFSIYMGERMQAAGLAELHNPCGTLFNPLSILALLRAMNDPQLALQSIFYASADGEWRSWLADTRLKGTTQEACAHELLDRLAMLKEALVRASHLYLTLGTNVFYRLAEEGFVVTNCQRQPDRLFVEESLNEPTCTQALEEIVKIVRAHNPSLSIIFTVSPFRYRKYTFHGSQLAKATLLLAIDNVCRQYSCCTYFPAYEIMMDELRDYRWYAADHIHPSPQAADYIWNKLLEANDEN